jgi:DNA-binding response OmpR family regulator
MKKILIIEDDPTISKGLQISLQAEHYDILTSASGEKGFQSAQQENIDLIILDLMLPGKNGEEICRDLRQKGLKTPILILTSRSEEIDKVLLLEMGADDYMTKPFGIRELQARVKALLRRGSEVRARIETYSFADISLDFIKQEASKKKKPLKLTTKEFEILHFFIQHEGQVISRDVFLDEVWGYEVFPTTRTVDNYILALRKKIEADSTQPKHLLTIPKAGYKFVK